MLIAMVINRADAPRGSTQAGKFESAGVMLSRYTSVAWVGEPSATTCTSMREQGAKEAMSTRGISPLSYVTISGTILLVYIMTILHVGVVPNIRTDSLTHS